MKRLVTAALVLLAIPAFAQTPPAKPATPPPAASATAACKAAVVPEHMMAMPKDLKWGDGPPGLPAGAKLAVLQGDPGQPNQVFTIRLKMPANFKISAHWHSADELVTVISGNLMIGHGEKADWKTMTASGPGGFFAMPAKMAHYAMAKGETIVQLHGIGPFDINYYDPKDDPRTSGAGTKAGQR
ncbi:MAG: cupin domain-containing protein [Myxococcaceae bacterium]